MTGRALCVGKHYLFDAENVRDEQEAVAICNGCLLKEDCKAGAHARREESGVWGGQTRAERMAELGMPISRAQRDVTKDDVDNIRRLMIEGHGRGYIALKLDLSPGQVANWQRRLRKEAQRRDR